MKKHLCLVLALLMVLSCVPSSVFALDLEAEETAESWAKAPKGQWQQYDGRWWYSHADGSCTVDDWEKIDGKWYHFDWEGYLDTGWVQIYGSWFYLGEDGVLRTGFKNIDGSRYYFDTDGVMQFGWILVNGKDYYMDPWSGAMVTDTWIDGCYLGSDGVWDPTADPNMGTWQQYEGRWWYLHADGSCTVDGWEEIEGKWYHFDSVGYLDTGWALIYDSWFYLGEDGVLRTGFQKIDGSRYYFDADGIMQFGWIHVKNKDYYMDPWSGAMVTDTWIDGCYLGSDGAWDSSRDPAVEGQWQQYEGRWWYCHIDGSCTIDDWEKIDGSWYYFDSYGYLHTGWLVIDNSWYYLDQDGKRVSGWQNIEGSRFYFAENGIMQTDWVNIGGKEYYFGTDGVLVTNQWVGSRYVGADGAWIPQATAPHWENVNGHWRYIHSDETYTTNNWEEINDRWYYFDADGYRLTGWQDLQGDRYYFDENGVMQDYWLELNGKRYFLQDGILQYGWCFDGSGYVYLGDEGYAHYGWLELDGNTYYLDEDGHMVTGSIIIDGKEYYFDATGAMSEKPMNGIQTIETCVGPVTVNVNMDDAKEVFNMVNAERTSRGLEPLYWNDDLLPSVMIRSAEISLPGQFSHTRPNGKSCFSVDPLLINGENIAAGYESPAAVMDGWMNSQGHRENILRPEFKSMAVGCVLSLDEYDLYRIYWVQLFSCE